MESKNVAFSGHRTFKMKHPTGLFNTETPSPAAIRDRLEATLRRLCEEGFDMFLCGMAEGFDMLAARCVLDLKKDFPAIKLTAVIPYPGQCERFSRENKFLYSEILARADHTVITSTHFSQDCFHRRNDYLVDNSSLLVCYFNGSKGGTEYTVKRALRKKHRIINISE